MEQGDNKIAILIRFSFSEPILESLKHTILHFDVITHVNNSTQFSVEKCIQDAELIHHFLYDIFVPNVFPDIFVRLITLDGS